MSNPKHPTQPAIAAIVLYRLHVEQTTKTYPNGSEALKVAGALREKGIRAHVQPFLHRGGAA